MVAILCPISRVHYRPWKSAMIIGIMHRWLCLPRRRICQGRFFLCCGNQIVQGFVFNEFAPSQVRYPNSFPSCILFFFFFFFSLVYSVYHRLTIHTQQSSSRGNQPTQLQYYYHDNNYKNTKVIEQTLSQHSLHAVHSVCRSWCM